MLAEQCVPIHAAMSRPVPRSHFTTSTWVPTRGHSVRVVTTGRQAIYAVREEEADLVLMDNQMPECSGIEASRSREDWKASVTVETATLHTLEPVSSAVVK